MVTRLSIVLIVLHHYLLRLGTWRNDVYVRSLQSKRPVCATFQVVQRETGHRGDEGVSVVLTLLCAAPQK